MATEQDLFDIIIRALAEKAQDPNIQPGDLEAITAMADDPEALAAEFGLELDGVPMDDDEANEHADVTEDDYDEANVDAESTEEHDSEVDEEADEASPYRQKSFRFRDETLAMKLARLRRQSRFAR